MNNFVDAQFLQAVWPQELDNVRLLIITVVDGRIATHDWNLFTPQANAQAAIDAGQHWAGQDVILKLENGHFTVLRALVSKDSGEYREHPIQDLLDMIGECKGTEAPGERQLLHLESIFGGEPDASRPDSVAQLFDSVFNSAQGPLVQSGEAATCDGPHVMSATRPVEDIAVTGSRNSQIFPAAAIAATDGA